MITEKVAIVTGGSGTIGKAIAKEFLKEAATVVLIGRRETSLEAARDELLLQLEASGCDTGNIIIKKADVTSEQDIERLFSELDSDGLSCDILVNNAGTASTDATVDMACEEFERVMRVNVVGPFLCSREALKRMKPQRSGRIINIGSLSAVSPRPHSAPYTSSKFALLGLTKSLALDAREYGVAVGIIHPGNVISNLLTEDVIEARGKTEGFISAQNVAACVLTMVRMPPEANILELTVLPTKQPLVGRG